MSLEDLKLLPQQYMINLEGFFTRPSSCTSEGLHSPGILKPIIEGKQVCPCQ